MTDEDFQQHRIWHTIRKTDGILRGFKSRLADDAAQLLTYVHDILVNCDAGLVAEGELEEIDRALIDEFNVIQNEKFLQERHRSLTDVLARALSRFPRPRTRGQFPETAEDIDLVVEELQRKKMKFDQSLQEAMRERESYTRELHEMKDDASEVLRGLLIELRSQVGIASNDLEEIRQRWTMEQERERADRSERLNSFISDQSDRFSKVRQDLVSKLGGFEDDFQKSLESGRGDLERSLSDAELIKEKIERIYEFSGQTILAGGFSSAADKENNLYLSNSRLAKLFFGLSIILLGLFAYRFEALGNFGLDFWLLRISVSLAMILTGAYCAALASRHRREANALRSLGLRIASFDAFINSLEVEEARSLRERVASDFFQNPFRDQLSDQNDLPAGKLLEILHEVSKKFPSSTK